MSATFNDLLSERGIVPEEVALLRYHTSKRGASAASIADLWRDDPDGFILYQGTQKLNRPIFRNRKIRASFVSPNPGDTRFVGLFDANF